MPRFSQMQRYLFPDHFECIPISYNMRNNRVLVIIIFYQKAGQLSLFKFAFQVSEILTEDSSIVKGVSLSSLISG